MIRLSLQMDHPAKQNYIKMFTDGIGLTDPQMMAAEVHETKAPTAFSYSLYYVYYD